jgi:hypothetical protein
LGAFFSPWQKVNYYNPGRTSRTEVLQKGLVHYAKLAVADYEQWLELEIEKEAKLEVFTQSSQKAWEEWDGTIPIEFKPDKVSRVSALFGPKNSEEKWDDPIC